jgi:hypothetical protein
VSDAHDADRSSKLPTILVVVILSVLCGLGIAAWFAARIERSSTEWGDLLQRGEPFVLSWLGDIRAGRLVEAYDATTPDTRARIDRAAFEVFFSEHPGFKAPPLVKSYSTGFGKTNWSVGLNGIRSDETPSRFVLVATLRPADGGESSEVEIVAVKDRASGRLLIDQFKIVPVPPAKP